MNIICRLCVVDLVSEAVPDLTQLSCPVNNEDWVCSVVIQETEIQSVSYCPGSGGEVICPPDHPF